MNDPTRSPRGLRSYPAQRQLTKSAVWTTISATDTAKTTPATTLLPVTRASTRNTGKTLTEYRSIE